MSDRLKYPKNGVVVFDNVREHIENDDFPQFPIGTIGGINGWYIKMEVDPERNKIYPFIYCPHKPEIFIKAYTALLAYKYPIFSKTTNTRMGSNYGLIGINTDTEVFFGKAYYENVDGRLSIRYGIQVESILGDDKIWKFNFYDKLFDCQEMRNMISFKHGKRHVKFLHCHKQLLSFQNKYFNSKSNKNHAMRVPSFIKYETIEQCLQIAHGVKLQVSRLHKCFLILGAARKLSLPNVIHYCEQKVIENYSGPMWIDIAIARKLNRWLAKLMKELESVKELKEILEAVNIDKMSGEAMKLCAKFMFENSK